MEFPIKSQEELDQVIGERLKRERETLAKKYADYDDIKAKSEDLEKKLGTLTSTIEEMKTKASGHDEEVASLLEKVQTLKIAEMKNRVAHEMGIPFELAGRLQGDDEETIRADAESLAGLIDWQVRKLPPLKTTEPTEEEPDGDYKTLLRNLGFEGD